MRTRFVYPRLPEGVAAELLNQYSGVGPADLVRYSQASHHRTTWYATAPNRVPQDVLEDVQLNVRKVAEEVGWPSALTRTTGTEFDRRVAAELYRRMGIIPADAACDDVWSFLSLVLLPDVAFWRWPNRERRQRYERILGRPRNVFRRLWHRVHVLGEELGSHLLEDEAVAILERPTLGGNPRIAKVVATEHLTAASRHPTIPRTELLRLAAKRLRRLSVVVCLEALDDRQLADVVGEIFAICAEGEVETQPAKTVSR